MLVVGEMAYCRRKRVSEVETDVERERGKAREGKGEREIVYVSWLNQCEHTVSG